VDAERELLDDVVHAGDGVLLRVAAGDLERPYPRRIVDRRVRVAANPAPLALEGQEFHVDLPLVAGHLLLVAVGVHGAPPDPVRASVQPVALEGSVHRGVAHPDAVVAFQVPDNPDGPEVVRPPQVENRSTIAAGVVFG
jgi:hypothetical protein